jgi:hypothetical protein
MGFAREQVIAALNANNGNDEAAVNSLLGVPAVVAPGATPIAPPKPPKQQSGFFGKIWGNGSK